LLWEGRAEDLLKALDDIAVSPEFAIDIKKARDWPKKANRLTKMLRPMLSNLREGYGISITIESDTTGKKTGTKNTRWIEIRKVSPPSPPSSPDENQAQKDGRNGGDDITATDRVSSPIRPETDAHFERSGDGEGGEDTFRLPLGNNNCSTVPLLDGKDYVAFDLEWTDDGTSSRTIYAAAFVDNHENSKLLHVSDFLKCDNPERELLQNVNQELSRYDLSMGWYSTGTAKYHEDTQEYLDGVDSDLVVLHTRCLANGVDSLIDFNSAGIPYVKGRKHIDLHSVFGKPMVQTTIFKNTYRTLKLDEVSRAVLLSKQQSLQAIGKYKGLTGKEVQSLLPVEEQKKYVLRDAELVMQLAKHNNGEVLDAMKAISELTGLNFDRVCRTGISAWWMSIFDSMVSKGESEAPALSSFNRKERQLMDLAYTGGSVLQPKKGLYHDLIVVDVTSLYPTMAILHNLSFDTVNCECCRDDLQCRLDNKNITKDCKIEKEYWVCKQKEGAFPKKLKIFKEERLKQKKLGNQVKQVALKILINGGYGVFGNHYFKYYDPRVAELITAYGRYTISKMKDIAQNMGFEVVYGDTDSLFLHTRNNKTDLSSNIEEGVSKLKKECSKQLGIEVEHAKTYKTAIISDKKHYIGWTGIQGKEPDIVGMEGDKNDRPKWINSVFRQTVYDIVTNSSINNNDCDPIANLKNAISNLQSCNVDPELLKRSHRLSKNPEEYENENDRKRKIGLAIGARKGDVIEYYESDNREGYSLNPQEISIRKYKVMLWKAVKDILEITGYGIAALEQDLILNRKEEKEDHMAKPPRGVVGYMVPNQFAESSL
jgi:DNA polymerase, archaea type